MPQSEDRPIRVHDRDMEEAEVHSLGAGEVAVFSSRSPGREGANEDSAAVIPFGDDAFVLAVADGMGGERGGAQASQLAIEALDTTLRAAARAGTMLRSAILDAFEHANRGIREIGVGGGTTLAVVEISEGGMRPYHVGDSTVLQIGQRGKLKLQTIAHSPVGFAVEAGWLDEGEAMHHEQRHLVSNVLGAADMRIEVGARRPLAARDTLLLASDGLSDNLHTDEIVALLRTGALGPSCSELAELARARMHTPRSEEPSKPDDLTFLAYRALRSGRRGAPG